MLQLRNVKANAMLRVTAVFALAVFLSASLFAQGVVGRIGGSVTDQTGGSIPGAKITITDINRGVARVLTTDAAGAYAAPNLTPGTYTVRAEFMGFRTLERKDIVIEVGQELQVDLTMQPGEQTQTVTVLSLIHILTLPTILRV